MAKFELGQVVMTAGISTCIKNNKQFEIDVNAALKRYRNADWSDMKYEEDKRQNNHAVSKNTGSIFATYNTCEGTIYIVTEWDRSITTILLPDEY